MREVLFVRCPRLKTRGTRVENDPWLVNGSKQLRWTKSVSTVCNLPVAKSWSRCFVKSSSAYLAKMTNFLFGFQGAVKLKPSGTRTNVTTCAHIAKQGFGQMLAFEISLGKTKSFRVIKTLADKLTLFNWKDFCNLFEVKLNQNSHSAIIEHNFCCT